MSEKLQGNLIYTEKFGWQVRFTFGKNISKSIAIHHSCMNDIQQNGMEGDEVFFIVRGTPAPNTLNGVVESALIIK